MEPLKKMKECGKHEKRPGENDMLRICETCGRQFYVCDLCRTAKKVDAPLSICLRCAPALKTLRNVLDKKDLEIYDLQNRLKKLDTDLRTNEELKKQITFLKRQNDEYKHQLKSHKEELGSLKKNNEKISNDYEKITEDVKPKNELTRDLKSLLTTQDYSDCIINCNGEKYQVHKCIIGIRSEPLRNQIKASMSVPQQQNNDPKNKPKQNTAVTQNEPSKITTIELNEIDKDIMPFILNYLYTGDTDNISDRNVQSVMKAADSLDLGGLRAACLLFMENRINRATCIPILIEAYELNHERLKNKCLKYIQNENIDLVNSPQWNNFKAENPKLALSLYERYVKEQSQVSTQASKRETQSNGDITSRSQQGQPHLNPVKNPIPQPWNPNNTYQTFNNKVVTGGNKNITVDR